MKSKKDKKSQKPKVHEDLKGYEVGIDSFGEITSNLNIEEINKFLNKNVEDKKLKDRSDLDFEPKRGSDEEE
jgi:hypothetical protein